MQKFDICTIIGLIGSYIASLFGGWDSGMKTLIIFMLVDYITGLVVAGVFHKSTKTKNGRLDSKIGWKGLSRKFVTTLFVLLGARIDLMAGSSYVRNAFIIGFCANEFISIIENAKSMGMKLPPVVDDALEVLNKKKEGKNAE